MGKKRIVILGATGSIGTQTLDVARALPDRVEVLGLSAHRSVDLLTEQVREFSPRWATLTDAASATSLPQGCNPSPRDGSTGAARDGVSRRAETESTPKCETEWFLGPEGVEAMVTHPDTDMVVAAMVGAAGLEGTVAALTAGKDIALANKETLVVGGPIVTELARKNGCALLPVDSEHSAIFQCMQAGTRGEVARVILTASGGPFRSKPLDEFPSITVEEALRHPTWQMGRKITIDSATMMNKALEIIEAHWLFGLGADEIDVLVHPQSMVHSFVEYVDGSVIAQVSPPDMRLPIQCALTYPERVAGPATKWNVTDRQQWEFIEPDLERYPALRLGYEVIRLGGTSGAALNAANEVAVARFLDRQIRFTEIVPLCADILQHHPYDPRPTLEELERVDRWARQEASRWTCSTSSVP